jgi:hypothetical protein
MHTSKTELLPKVTLLFIIISRFISEISNTYFYHRSNFVWGVSVIFLIFAILWPILALQNKGELHNLKRYFPVILYIIYISFRTDYFELISFKSFLSEFIVWALFLTTNKFCEQNEQLSNSIQKLIVLIIQLCILIGLFQLVLNLFHFFPSNVVNLEAFYDLRPVHSIFNHPNSFVIIALPFSIYF